MRLIPAGLGIIAALQTVAAVTAYPILTLAVSLAASILGNMASPDPGARTILFLAGLPTAFGVLLLAGIFIVVPLVVCVAGAAVVGWLGRRRRAAVSMAQMLKFGTAVVIMNVAALFIGVLISPVWFYSQKLSTLIPLWPLVLSFTLNAALDAALTGITLRSQLRAR